MTTGARSGAARIAFFFLNHWHDSTWKKTHGENGNRIQVIPVSDKLVPCQATDGTRSALGLVGPLSAYCGWVRQKDCHCTGMQRCVSRWDWSARCPHTLTGRDRKFELQLLSRTFDLQLLSQCGSTYNCPGRSVLRYASMLLKRPAANQQQHQDMYLLSSQLASASRAEGPGFESRLRRDFFGAESYQ